MRQDSCKPLQWNLATSRPAKTKRCLGSARSCSFSCRQEKILPAKPVLESSFSQGLRTMEVLAQACTRLFGDKRSSLGLCLRQAQTGILWDSEWWKARRHVLPLRWSLRTVRTNLRVGNEGRSYRLRFQCQNHRLGRVSRAEAFQISQRSASPFWWGFVFSRARIASFWWRRLGSRVQFFRSRGFWAYICVNSSVVF